MYSVDRKNYVNIVVVYSMVIVFVSVMLCVVNSVSGINGCVVCDLIVMNSVSSMMVVLISVMVCVDS